MKINFFQKECWEIEPLVTAGAEKMRGIQYSVSNILCHRKCKDNKMES